jgi:signal transduction histidine kinase
MLLRSTRSGVEVVDTNRTAADLLGTAPEQPVDVPLTAYRALAGATDLVAAAERVARREVPRWRLEHEVDPERKTVVEITLSPGPGPDDVLAQLVDRSDDQRLRDQAARHQDGTAAEVEKATSGFVSSVSHELRTPLTSVLGCTELLLEGTAGELNSQQDTLVRSIRRNGERLQSLVLNLLELASADAGTPVTARQDFDLRQVARHSCEAVEALRSACRIDLELTCASSPTLVNGDAAKVEHAVRNLLTNAITVSPPGGRVRVRVETVQRECVVEVGDSGPGIPVEEQRSLTRRFFRTSTARAAHLPGVGVGLAAARSIVADHGGRLDVRSTPGHGASVMIRLPRVRR